MAKKAKRPRPSRDSRGRFASKTQQSPFAAFGSARQQAAEASRQRARIVGPAVQRAWDEQIAASIGRFAQSLEHRNALTFARRYVRMVTKWLAAELGGPGVQLEQTWRQSSTWLEEPHRAVSVRKGKALPGVLDFGVGDWPWKPADFEGFIWSTRLRFQEASGNHQWHTVHKHTSNPSQALGEIKRSARNLTKGTPSIPEGGRFSGCDAIVRALGSDSTEQQMYFRFPEEH